MSTVFISYSHRDKQWLDRVLIHLRPLEREGYVTVDLWADTRIAPGGKWRNEIRDAIESAEVAVLLVSADYLASDFIAREELPPLLEGADNLGITVLPVIVSPCRYEHTVTLSHFQSVNDPRKPLTKLTGAEQEDVFVGLSEEIRIALLKPITRLQQELQEELRAADVMFEPLLKGLKGLATNSSSEEKVRQDCLLSGQVAVNDRKVLIVAHKITEIAKNSDTDPLYSRHRAFLEQELEKFTRTGEVLKSKLKNQFRH
jgi:hypothetical protein